MNVNEKKKKKNSQILSHSASTVSKASNKVYKCYDLSYDETQKIYNDCDSNNNNNNDNNNGTNKMTLDDGNHSNNNNNQSSNRSRSSSSNNSK